MPLILARPGQIPEVHSDGCQCVFCVAAARLDAADWSFVDFYRFVQDQTDNLAPLGDADGRAVLRLRLESLEAACRLLLVPPWLRGEVVSIARDMHNAVNRETPDLVREAYSCAASDLEAPAEVGEA